MVFSCRFRHKQSIFAFFFGLLLAVTAVSGVQAQDLVRIGVGVDPVYTPWWIAQEKGLFAKYNIKSEIRQMSGGPDIGDATIAGELDIASSGSATMMPRIARGNMLVIGNMATSLGAISMAALTSIKSLNDLKGKKVGTVAGSTTDYLWYLLTRKLGVPESAITLVAAPPPELVPALDRQDIVAFFCWAPWPTRAVEVSGSNKVHILANNGDVGYLLNFVVVANQKFATSKPDVTARVLAALRDAIAYQNSHPEEAKRIAAETNRLKPDFAGQLLKIFQFSLGIPLELEQALKEEEAWMRSQNRIKGNPIDWSSAIQRTYLDKALKLK